MPLLVVFGIVWKAVSYEIHQILLCMNDHIVKCPTNMCEYISRVCCRAEHSNSICFCPHVPGCCNEYSISRVWGSGSGCPKRKEDCGTQAGSMMYGVPLLITS